MDQPQLALPVFAFVEERAQVQDLRAYLVERGAKLKSDVASEDVAADVIELIEHCDILATKVDSETELETVLSSLCSFLASLPQDVANKAVNKFCEKLSSEQFNGTGWNSKAGAVIRVLSSLFYSYVSNKKGQDAVYIALVKQCGRAGLIGDLPTDVENLRQYVADWGLNVNEKRNLLRMVHEALIKGNKPDAAGQVMIELLGTYASDADAGAALSDARDCVRTALVDSKTFSVDHLLRLKPVQQLQKSEPLIYKFLMLVANGTLEEYTAFTKTHPNFVAKELRVDDEILQRKMRLLSLVSLAEKSNTLSFAELSQALGLKGEDLEEFIIDSIQSKVITGKIDHLHDRLVISSFQHRTFGRPQWEQLQQRLAVLSANLRMMQGSFVAETPSEVVS